MNHAARRRLTWGVLGTSTALVAGLVVAPAVLAAPESAAVSPTGAVNTEAARELTFTTTDADLNYGGTATFTRAAAPASPFEVTVDGPTLPSLTGKTTEGTGTADLTDGGTGLGVDGPINAGVYNLSITGNDNPVPLPGLPPGGGNDTRSSAFTVLPAGPVDVTSVAPALAPGTSGDVSIIGNNFERGAVVEVLNPDGTIDAAITTNAAPSTGTDGITTKTELKRRFTLGAGAVPGVRDVRVRLLDYPTGVVRSDVCDNCFTVSGPPLSAVSPTADFNDPTGTPVQLTFSGSNVTDGQATLEFVGTPGTGTPRSALTLTGTRVSYSPTALVATFDLRDAAPGLYQPVVRNAGDGTVNACVDACRFTVIQRDTRQPTLATVDRTGTATGKTQTQGTTGSFDLTGTNFSRGAGVTVSGEGVTTTSVAFDSNQKLVAGFAVAPTAPAGDRNVTVTLTDGKTVTCTACYTVVASAASPSPSPTASPAAAGRYTALGTPTRVLDTRKTGGQVSGATTLDLSSALPGSTVTAALLNITVTDPTAGGFLVAYPAGTTRPGTSNVNFEARETQANEAVVRLPADKKVTLFLQQAGTTGKANVIVDLVGSFTSASGEGGRIDARVPTRAFDSRTTATPRRTGNTNLAIPGVPTGATDVILNVTATTSDPKDKGGVGFVTVFPTGTTRPGTSNVNFGPGQTRANEVVSKLGNGGSVTLYAETAVALVVDVVGFVVPPSTAGSDDYIALASPKRVLDSRSGLGTSTGRKSGETALTLPADAVPAGATGVVLNVTATGGTPGGFVAVYPFGTANPGTSNVNFPAAVSGKTAGTQANQVTTLVSGDRKVVLLVGGPKNPQTGGPTAVHLIADVVGYFVAG